MKKDNQKRINKNYSNISILFANAINYKALEKAMNDPQFIAIIKKIKY